MDDSAGGALEWHDGIASTVSSTLTNPFSALQMKPTAQPRASAVRRAGQGADELPRRDSCAVQCRLTALLRRPQCAP